jgi:tetratricopeptide (TPR) repeat protein
MKRARVLTIAALALALSSGEAQATTCNDILNMLNVGVPANTVTATMAASRAVYTQADIDCLASGGAPPAVVMTAQSMKAVAAPSPTPVPDAPTRSAPPSSAIDSGPDIIGDRVGAQPRQLNDGAGPVPENTDPPLIQEAIKLIKNKKPLSGTLRLYDALKSQNYPDQRTKINYYMARGLEQLEMYHSAQYFFLAVVKDGQNTTYFKYALPKLVKIARITGDESDLIRLAPRIAPEAYPPKAKNQMYYLMGLRKMTQKDPDLSAARKYFSQISSKSSLYLRSRYLEGVIYNKQGKLKSAVRSFRDVYRHRVEARQSSRQSTQTQALKDLSLVNIARIYYKIERFDESTKYFNLVARDSVFWPESLFDGAWSHFMQNNLNESLGHLLTVQSPFFSEEDFLPEVEYLRALTFFNLCEYKEVDGYLLSFESRMKPVQEELKNYVKGYATKEARRMADKAWDDYFGDRAKQTLIPKSLFTRMLRNQDIRGIVDHMALMDDELDLIDKQKPQWRDTVGEMLRQDVIAKDRRKFKVRAGKFMLAEMARHANILQDLLSASEIVRFEMIDAQRVDYQYKFQNPDIADMATKVDLDFATGTEFIYWPFNGEFWSDELGYYHYTEQGSCK